MIERTRRYRGRGKKEGQKTRKKGEEEKVR